MTSELISPETADDLAVREIAGPNDASLSLRGTVLVHKATTWAGRSSLFIPIECLSISRASRFNSPFLIRGMRVLLCGAVFGLPLPLIPDEHEMPYLTVYLAVLSIATVYFLYTFMHFLRRRPTVRFEALVREGVICIECWNDRPELDRLVGRIKGLQKKVDELIPYPAQMSCQLFQMKSLRLALMRATILTFFLAAAIAIIVHYTGETRLWYFLALPWVVYPGKYLLDRARLRGQPLSFRRAVEAFEEDKLERAQSLLAGLLSVYPDYLPGLILKIQVCTLLGNFPSAFQACEHLARHEPEIAESLQEEVLSVEQLQRRMDMEV